MHRFPQCLYLSNAQKFYRTSYLWNSQLFPASHLQWYLQRQQPKAHVRPGRPSSHQICSSPRAVFRLFDGRKIGKEHGKIMMVIIWWYVKTLRIVMDSDGLCVITGNWNHVITIGVLWAFPWLWAYEYEMMGLLWDDNTWLLWWALCNHVIICDYHDSGPMMSIWWDYGILHGNILKEFPQVTTSFSWIIHSGKPHIGCLKMGHRHMFNHRIKVVYHN